MQKLFILYILVISCILSAFMRPTAGGSIYGRIKPYNGALKVWAVSDTDTGKAVVQNGEFDIKHLSAGRYRVIVEGQRPYKVTTKPDVIVSDSASTDVGEIVLDQ